jgi:hypothetical protein
MPELLFFDVKMTILGMTVELMEMLLNLELTGFTPSS